MRFRLLSVILILFFAARAFGQDVVEYPYEKVSGLLRKVEQEKNLCFKPLKENETRPGACRSKKMLLAMEVLLKSYLVLQAKNENLERSASYLSAENKNLKHELIDTRNPASFTETSDCFKQAILKKLMIDEGIPENGSALFIKKTVPAGKGSCWTNARKKREATITLCDYPLAIDIETRGGTGRTPVVRQREYLFSLNGCDLMSIHITDQDQVKTRETFISYDQCIKQWNQRDGDAAMSKEQVKTMQDTIGVCFRENLLPPREAKNGRENPHLPREPAVTKSSESSVNSGLNK